MAGKTYFCPLCRSTRSLINLKYHIRDTHVDKMKKMPTQDRYEDAVRVLEDATNGMERIRTHNTIVAGALQMVHRYIEHLHSMHVEALGPQDKEESDQECESDESDEEPRRPKKRAKTTKVEKSSPVATRVAKIEKSSPTGTRVAKTEKSSPVATRAVKASKFKRATKAGKASIVKSAIKAEKAPTERKGANDWPELVVRTPKLYLEKKLSDKDMTSVGWYLTKIKEASKDGDRKKYVKKLKKMNNIIDAHLKRESAASKSKDVDDRRKKLKRNQIADDGGQKKNQADSDDGDQSNLDHDESDDGSNGSNPSSSDEEGDGAPEDNDSAETGEANEDDDKGAKESKEIADEALKEDGGNLPDDAKQKSKVVGDNN